MKEKQEVMEREGPPTEQQPQQDKQDELEEQQQQQEQEEQQEEQQPGRNCAGSGPEAGVRGGHGQPVSATCTLFGGHPRAVGVRIRSRGGLYGTARAVEGVQN